MNLNLQHIEVHVSSLEKAREFYITILGLELIEETPALNLFSVKAGGVRISIFGGYDANTIRHEKMTGTHIIFRTDDILKTKNELLARGHTLNGEMFEAPGFIKGFNTADPDGNIIEIAEYLRDPLKPAE
jgi:predicted enzyme related to lactoylglutathione lyase